VAQELVLRLAMNKEQLRQALEMLISWVRVFAAAIVAQLIAGVDSPGLLVNAGLAAVLPVVLRWLDPDDKTYGRGVK
jgi:hypothetical protein